MKSPVSLLSCLFEDFERHDPSIRELSRDLRTAKLRFENEGFGFFTKTLPTIGDALDRGLADGAFSSPTSFKRRGALPIFMSGLLRKVFDMQTGLLLDEPCIHAIKCLRETCFLFKKVLLDERQEQKLHISAVKEFVQCDESIRNIDVSDWRTLATVARISLPTLQNYKSGNIHCKNGPGSVAEGYRPNQKWSGLLRSVFDSQFVAEHLGYDNFIHEVAIDNCRSLGQQSSACIPSLTFPIGISKLITVPKNTSARRTITVEPALHQFVQQGLNSALRDSIAKCAILRNSLDLKDQGHNQRLAVQGSLTGALATIDLKSASDRLSQNLCKIVFSGKPILADLLMARSKLCSVDGRIVELSKYAGMGNATTFPVQSICFALICIASILDHDGLRPTKRNAMRASKNVRVFGDDIIIPVRYYTSVSDRLTSCGLQVNHKKSFATGFFRESCGVDAYKGVDVTPLRLRRWTVAPSEKPLLVQHLVALSNSMFDRCLYSASRFLQEWVEGLVGPLPLVRRDSPSLGWHCRVDANVAQKWDGKTQRLVFRGLVCQGFDRPDRLDGYAALFRWFCESSQHHCDDPLRHLDVKVEPSFEHSQIRFRQRLRRRWLPA